MTRTRRTLLGLAAAGILAAGAWFALAPGDPGAAPVAAPAPRPTDTTWPLLAAGPSGTPVATPGPTATRTPPAPATTATTAGLVRPVAEPFVQTFAGQPGVEPLKALPSPTKTHYVRPNVDGCDHNYGTVTQCVPWTFPPGTTDKCAWLAGHGFTRLAVAAADRQRLDPDGNRIACDD